MTRRARPVAETKKLLIEQIAAGHTVARACAIVGRTVKSYEKYRADDPDFRATVDRIRMEGGEQFRKGAGVIGTFPDFADEYLGQRVFPHMQNVVDVIEGREPGFAHPSMVWEPGEPDLAIVNMPPEHAKTTTVTINYVTYRIAKDPNVKVIIVSKTTTMARKFLRAVKDRLTHPRYQAMQLAFGPPGGYQGDTWSQDMIYVSGEARDSGEAHPTVEAIGIRSHIYGARADLIILDDCVDLTNAHEFDKQIDWIQSEVLSRISASGMCLVVGTRLSPRDLYSELRDPSRYSDEVSPWSYLSMPAVLDFKDDPRDWVTLWPKSNVMTPGAKGDLAEPDSDGLYPKWDGIRLNKKRARMSPATWARVYMQQQVAEDTIFHPDAVRACINGNRLTGLIPNGMHSNRPGGMHGLVVMAGLDPAMAGHTAAVVIGLDLATQKRYVLDVWNQASMTPDQIREMITNWTGKYGIVEWRIEKNAFQSMLTQDREVREALASRGAILREHFTGSNKWDSDFGVASMTTLFSGWEDGRQLIEFPSSHRSEAMKATVEQLVTWAPDVKKGHKTDIVMALWFAELACRDRIQAASGFGRSHVRNPFATRYDKRRRAVINLAEVEQNMMWSAVNG